VTHLNSPSWLADECKMTVLIADDYAPLRRIMRDVLESAGSEVIEAENGAVALQTTARHDFEVILLDLKMPVCDGYEVLRRLDEPRPLVIVLSGFEQMCAENVKAEFGSQVFATLRKPVPLALLLDTVRRAVASNRTRQTVQSCQDYAGGLVTSPQPLCWGAMAPSASA